MGFDFLLISYGVFQGIFIALILLFSKRISRQQKLLLIPLIGVLSLLSADYVLSNYYLMYQDVPFWGIGLASFFWLAIGPLFYLLSCALIQTHPIKSKLVWLHLSPLCLSLVANMPFFLLSAELRQEYLMAYSSGQAPTLLHILSKTVYHAHLILYPILIFRIIRQHQQSCKSIVFYLNLGLLLIGVASFAHLICFNFFQLSFSWFTSTFIFISLSIIVHLAATLLLVRPDWMHKTIPEIMGSNSNSNLSNIDILQLQQDLRILMLEEKIYRQPKLKLAELAFALQVSPHQLSEYLNRENEQSFRDFINSYRIQDAQQLMLAPDSKLITIEAIAYEAGFNSSASFYRSFKKCIGTSPQNWLKRRSDAEQM